MQQSGSAAVGVVGALVVGTVGASAASELMEKGNVTVSGVVSRIDNVGSYAASEIQKCVTGSSE